MNTNWFEFRVSGYRAFWQCWRLSRWRSDTKYLQTSPPPPFCISSWKLRDSVPLSSSHSCHLGDYVALRSRTSYVASTAAWVSPHTSRTIRASDKPGKINTDNALYPCLAFNSYCPEGIGDEMIFQSGINRHLTQHLLAQIYLGLITLSPSLEWTPQDVRPIFTDNMVLEPCEALRLFSTHLDLHGGVWALLRLQVSGTNLNRAINSSGCKPSDGRIVSLSPAVMLCVPTHM